MIKRLAYFFALPFALVANGALAESYGHIPDAAIYLGRGFDPLYPQKVFPLCVKSKGECQADAKNAIGCLTDQVKDSQPDMGHTTTFSVRQIKSKYEFFREVNISASLSGGYGPFSGSASFSSYELDEVNEDSLSWMVTAKTFYGSFALQNPSVAFDRAGPSETINKCGPNYVSEVDRGVVATALFTVYNLDEKHQKEVRASMSAGFSTGAFDINGSAKFSEVVKTALQYGSMSIRVYTIGGSGQPGLSGLVSANPTDLEKVKGVLESYTKAQNTTLSAVVGFRTSGIGKLAGDASLDPDQTSYYYYLERANNYRLSIIDALKKTDDLLRKRRDFSSSVVTTAEAARDNLSCELSYAEAAMQTCRFTFEQTRRHLVDGDATDDRPTELALTYGLPSTSTRLQVCPSARITNVAEINAAGTKVDKSTTGPNFVALGWARAPAPSRSALLASCGARLDLQRKRLAEMLETAGLPPGRASPRGAAPNLAAAARSSRRPCISGCELEMNDDALAAAASLPSYPFKVRFWFDAGLPSFGSTTLPGLNVLLRDASSVRTVRFYRGTENSAFGVRNANGTSDVVMFLPVTIVDGETIRMEVETENSNLFVVFLPYIKQLP